MLLKVLGKQYQVPYRVPSKPGLRRKDRRSTFSRASRVRGLLPGRWPGGAIQRQPLEIDHFQLVGIVVGHEQRLAVRRVPELARERAGGHASQNRCLTCADVCRINHGQRLPRSSVAGKAV